MNLSSLLGAPLFSSTKASPFFSPLTRPHLFMRAALRVFSSNWKDTPTSVFFCREISHLIARHLNSALPQPSASLAQPPLSRVKCRLCAYQFNFFVCSEPPS